MKKLLLLLTILMVVVVGTTSCLSDDLGGGGKKPPAVENGFLMSFDVEKNVLTGLRSTATEPGEADVQQLHLFFFEASGSQNFIDYIVIENDDEEDDEGVEPTPIRMSTPIKVEFDPASPLNGSTDYRVLIVANIGNYVNLEEWIAEFDRMSYAGAELIVLSLSDIAGRGISPGTLPMSATAQKAANQDVLSATLQRMPVRLDVDMGNIAWGKGFQLGYASVWNVPETTSIWNPMANSYSSHTRLFDIAEVENPAQVRGGLYGFENRVVGVTQNDNKSTCLIIGLVDTENVWGQGAIRTYYRVNVNASSGEQILQRNHVYNVTIRDVLGPGAPTPEEAYTGAQSLLDVSTNEWNLGNMGPVQGIGDDVLALPTTRITFSPEGNIEGETFFVYTFSPDLQKRLTISRLELPAGIEASLVGNTLRVTATPSEDTKTGYIELAFGGMRGIIEVRQTGEREEFLTLRMSGSQVDMDIDDIPKFPVNPRQMTGSVRVTSSGPWTATLHSSGNVFTFQSGILQDTYSGISGATFTVATRLQNIEPRPRLGFIVVSLDSNPDVSQVLLVEQEGTGEILITPTQALVEFNEDGNPLTNNVFHIDAGGMPFTPQLIGTDANQFIIDDSNSPTLTIVARDRNFSGRVYDAQLRVFVTGQLSTAKHINLTQTSHVLTLNPTAVAPVPTIGGYTPWVTVTSAVPWRAKLEIAQGLTSPDGRSIVNHNVRLETEAGVVITEGMDVPVGQRFRVWFDKLYYPNREIPVQTTVTVWIEGTPLERTMNVNQVTLTSRGGMQITGLNTHSRWGGLTGPYTGTSGTFNERMRRELGATSTATTLALQPPMIASTAGTTANSTAGRVAIMNNHVIAHSTTMVWVSNRELLNGTGVNNRVTWNNVNNYRQDLHYGLLVMSATDGTSAGATGAFTNDNSPLRQAGITSIARTNDTGGTSGATGSTAGRGTISTLGSVTSTKLYQFLVGAHAPTPIANLTAWFDGDGNHTSTPVASLPAGAVPLITQGASGVEVRAGLVIDPANRIIYIGESDYFGSNNTTVTSDQFLHNFMFYLENAAKFGTAFMDMFIDDPNHPRYVPAPWDPIWGANRVDPRTGVPTR
ncbi:MAG: hypothetical protein LBI15_05990 [Dysgonamonadaceae bacterium]|jgi:hypothetical protein|nr:hypothetical protein [Dysgonamonadaceae bacterium]